MVQVKLKVVGGARAGEEVPVPAPRMLIGRAEDCHLRARSGEVSRHHCAVLVEGEAVTVRDFGSRNGTFVNGERIAGERALAAGDRLKVGSLEFEVVVSAAPAAKKKPKVRGVGDAMERVAHDESGPSVGDMDAWFAEEDDRSFAEEVEAEESAGRPDEASRTTVIQPTSSPTRFGPATSDSCEAATEALRRLQRRNQKR